ncbi:MAG: cytochrome c biogenesis protein CcsA [Bacteroidetes bacterium]|nr:cytochrome c biogenesis protein CcsA [Bacteroidota bacterium]
MEISYYAGENLQFGKWGHVFVLIAFVFAILSSVAHYFAVEGPDHEKEGWRKIGRWSFFTHAIAVAGIVALLFAMLYNHRYEYHYVWKHSNNIMPLRYILSCFWEGQEGSFLLWTIWHVVLGSILCFTAKKWESPVMAIFSAVQVFLISMLLGIHIPEGPYAGIMIITVGLFILFLIWNRLSNIEKYTIGGAIVVIGGFIANKNIPGFHIGSSPFNVLTREYPQFADDLLFKDKDYLKVLDGNGLNPLLQNYWMTIHPPMLFLGFASTLVPFAFAIAGLWTKKLNEWMNPALPWIFFGVAALGTGILMGGAWAYEALSFGGFWAWDPVENASLFPWLTFVGAAHVMIIQRKKGKSSYVTFLLTMVSFLLVLYSTYLTRSGILGETSVHSFADGLPGQLLIFLFFFWWLAGYLVVWNKMLRIVYTVVSLCFFVIQFYVKDLKVLSIVLISAYIAIFVFSYLKYYPKDKDEKEESITSREFWMFIAAIMLLISCLQILISTSLPVVNKIFGTKYASAKDVFESYVQYQILFGFIICLLMGSGLYLKYTKTPGKKLLRDFTTSFFITSILCLIVALSYQFDYENSIFRLVIYWLFFFSAIFAIVGNVGYFITVLKGKIKSSGAPIAHLGFGMIMLGAFISTSQSEVISENTSKFDLEKASDNTMKNNENIFLSRGDTLPMGPYYVTFNKIFQDGKDLHFDVEYLRKKEDSTFEKDFTLSPFFQLNEKMGKVPEPDTKHYLHKDIYTHLQTYKVAEHKGLRLGKGDTVTINNAILYFKAAQISITRPNKTDSAFNVGAVLEVYYPGKAKDEFVVMINDVSGKNMSSPETQVEGLKAKFKLVNINYKEEYFEFEMTDYSGGEFIVMKAIQFPLINILWAGCIVMIIGTVIAIVHRTKNSKRLENAG